MGGRFQNDERQSLPASLHWQNLNVNQAFPHSTEISTPIEDEPMDGIENDGRWVVTRREN